MRPREPAEMIRRAVDILVSASVLVLTSPLLALAVIAIRLESAGHPIYRQRRVGLDGAAVRRAEAAHDGRRRRAHRRRAGGQRERFAHHPRRGAPAPDLARRAAEPAERAPRGDVADRAAPDVAGPGRAVHPPSARSPADQAGHHRLGAGQRPHVACPGASGSSSTSTTSPTARWRSTCGSSGARSRSCSAARTSTRARPAAGRASCDAGSRSFHGPNRLRCTGAGDARAAGDPADRRGQALRHRLLLCAPHHDDRRRPLARSRPRSTPRRCVPRSR